MRPLRLLPFLLAGLLTAACTDGAAPREAEAPGPQRAAVSAEPAITWHGRADRPTKVLVIVLENHSEQEALGQMPYLAALSRRYGYTTEFLATTRPSLPNYLAMFGGSTFGVRDNRNPSAHPISGPSVFDRVLAAGKTAKSYSEAMPSNCALLPSGRYAVKHNPWPYFSDPGPRANCRRFNVPAGTVAAGPLRSDVTNGRLPVIGLLVPDMCNSAHDCSLAVADGWVRSWMQVILAGPDYRRGRLAVIVTFDEDDGVGENAILTTVVSPYTSRVVSARRFTHYSLTRYFAELTGTAPLRAGATAPSLRATFGI